MDVFTGRRVVAVVTGPGLDPPDAVQAAFGGHVSDFIVLPNDPNLREVQTLVPLLERVQTLDPGEVTFYAHAKAVTRPGHPTCWRWAQAMYELCLDYVPLADDALQTHAAAGPFKRRIKGWRESDSPWHFSGSFAWFRNKDLFAADWRRVERFWSGVEPYLSLHVPYARAYALGYEWHRPGPGLYDRRFFEAALREVERWKARHARWRRNAPAGV